MKHYQGNLCMPNIGILRTGTGKGLKIVHFFLHLCFMKEGQVNI